MQKMLGPIPIEMYEKIPDPEALWKATNEVWIAEQAKKEIRKNPRDNVNEEDVTFIVDSTGHGDNSILPDLQEGETWLRDHFVSFDLEESLKEFDLEASFQPGDANNW